jgi:enamine deaminase RidA (YjgF/YER057c/UK114 family)
MSAEARIQELELDLPSAPPKGGVYKPVVVVDNLAYVSGHGPYQNSGAYIVGKVGHELTEEQGNQAAKQTGLAMLATLRAELGSLDRIKRVIKLFGMVNSTEEFAHHPQVINGCSELFAEVWGEEAGIGARSAVGLIALPGHIAVEIEAVFELHPE